MNNDKYLPADVSFPSNTVFNYSTSNLINPNYQNTLGLVNYWSFNGNLNDLKGGASLFGGINFDFTTDRFNSDYSAILNYLMDI